MPWNADPELWKEEVMTERPKVSIGMPVFNGERFIAETIDSIAAQTFPNFELIISDNASTDGTEKICRQYADEDARIRYVRNRENLGAAYNYNQTFHLSSGEYFKWACHDDLLRPEFLQRCVEVLDRDPSAVVAYTDWAPIDEAGDLLQRPEPRYPPWRANSPDPVERTRFTFRMERRPPSAIYGLFRADALRRTGLYRPTHGGDHIMMAEISLYGPVREVPEMLFLNRWHSESGSKISTFRDRVDWWLPESGRGRVGRGPVGALLLFAKTMAQTATAQVGSIRRSPLSSGDKFRCYAQLPLWFAGEFWRRLERRLPEQLGGRT
jgi:glycosyltransferase involved in cell wall biosynthesis